MFDNEDININKKSNDSDDNDTNILKEKLIT